MNATCRCPKKTRRRAMANGAGWIIPGILLILLPKCPLCLAAALSVICGIALSTDAATVVHGSAIALCAFAMLLFAARQFSWIVQHLPRISKHTPSDQHPIR